MKDKTIPINIKGQPPTQAELDTAVSRLLKIHAISRVTIWMGAILISYISYLAVYPPLQAGMKIEWLKVYGAILFVSLYLTGFSVYFTNNPSVKDYDPICPEKHPHACLQFSKLLSNQVVATYHKQVLLQGRVPVMLEYEAAEAWVESESEREKQEKAKAAFAKINTPEGI